VEHDKGLTDRRFCDQVDSVSKWSWRVQKTRVQSTSGSVDTKKVQVNELSQDDLEGRGPSS
jgi:hypothetical protein